MDDRSDAAGNSTPDLIVVGLGPGDLDRLPQTHRRLLMDPDQQVVVRTRHHPAASQLSALRPVEACDDLYESADDYAGVYAAIVDRLLDRAATEPTVYAVPGSPLVGEFAVRELLARHPLLEVVPAESFVDAMTRSLGVDPLERGLRILNGHRLPTPLLVSGPTIVGHLDTPEVVADVSATLSRVLPEGAEVTICRDLGSEEEQIVTLPVDEVPAALAGLRTSLFVDSEPAGLVGAIEVGLRLRAECPWDREQTHTTLVRHLSEEVAELVDAIARLPEEGIDYVAYDAVEDELGDVLLQVLFHSAIAAEAGAFTIEDVGTRLREKLVRRHPHVFGDVAVSSSDEVVSNWARIKEGEKHGQGGATSRLDGVPAGLASLARALALQARAAEVGFDWTEPGEVVSALANEVTELDDAVRGKGDHAHELGDVIFAAVNLARHLGVDPEVAIRQASHRFEQRFRQMEAMGSLEGLDPDELEERWQAAKTVTRLAEGDGVLG